VFRPDNERLPSKEFLMTIFELVKLALDELYEEGLGEHGSKLDEIIKKRMGYLSKSYASLTEEDRSAISYSDPATRFAYVYMYVAALGDYLVQLLDKIGIKLGSLPFDGGTLRASCLGGGPGSDVIALLKYLEENQDTAPEKVICYLLDGEQAWADTWTEFSASLTSDVRLTTNFQPLDVTQPSSWKSQKKFLQSDLFTLSYFVSEVWASDGDGAVTAFWKKIFDEAKARALFVYIDNGSDEFNEYFDEQWENRSDMECLLKTDNVRFTPRYSEQATDLGEYLSKFGKSPKIQAWLSYRVLRKKT
jgi:hypothetical protein